MTTEVSKFIAELDGGMLEEQLSHVISDVAGSVVEHGRQGEINLKLAIKRIGNGYQVQIDSTLKFKRPTTRGSVQEEQTTGTPMHVGTRGAVTFFAENQGQIFDQVGKPTSQPYPDGDPDGQ